jgi:hypothetical protein
MAVRGQQDEEKRPLALAGGMLDFATFPSAFGPGVGKSVGLLPARPEPVEIGQATAANG